MTDELVITCYLSYIREYETIFIVLEPRYSRWVILMMINYFVSCDLITFSGSTTIINIKPRIHTPHNVIYVNIGCILHSYDDCNISTVIKKKIIIIFPLVGIFNINIMLYNILWKSRRYGGKSIVCSFVFRIFSPPNRMKCVLRSSRQNRKIICGDGVDGWWGGGDIICVGLTRRR